MRFVPGFAAMLVVLVAASVSVSDAGSSFALSPSTTVVAFGGGARLLPVYDADGAGSGIPQYLTGGAVTWSSSNPAVALVDTTGLVYGRKRGTATIRASYKGNVATTTVTVAGVMTSGALMTSDGRTRTWTAYVPDGYSSARPAPLVLAYHGYGGYGFIMMHVTQLNTVAHAHNFIVAYPNGTGTAPAFNAGGCCGEAMQNGIDDVGFTRRLIDEMRAHYTIDSRRVYATGFSNGGIMAHRLGVQLADRIAAVASVSGELYPGGDFVLTAPVRPVSVLMFHGTTDLAYPYNPQAMLAIQTWWMWNDGIPAEPSTIVYQRGIETCSTNANAAAEVTLCLARPSVPLTVNGVVYDGGGHAWPGGVRVISPSLAADLPTYDIDASAVIWDFFARHSMP